MNDRQPNFPQPEMDDQDEGRVVEGGEITALAQLNSAEINQQIMTARAFPRSIVGFRRSMREMVTYDEATALSCLYALKRSGKVIEGPSIRFAEAAAQSWGNVRCGARVVDIGDEFITGQGFFYDLEKNVAIAVEVMRRITDSKGARYGDDMIGVTGNASCSIALRNAILRGIPKTAWLDPYLAAKDLAVGKGESITIKRENMIKAFAPLGVSKEQIFGLLGVKGLDDVTYENLMLLAGVLNSIKEGGEKAEVIFSIENMVNPDQVRPPAPRKGDFAGAGAGAGGGKGAAAPKAPVAAEAPKDPPPPQEPQQQAEDGNKSGEEAERRRLGLVEEAYAELKAAKRIRDIPALRERVVDSGIMTEAEEAAWVKDTEARAEEMLNAAQKPKK